VTLVASQPGAAGVGSIPLDRRSLPVENRETPRLSQLCWGEGKRPSGRESGSGENGRSVNRGFIASIL
jgi:hypothetical protein